MRVTINRYSRNQLWLLIVIVSLINTCLLVQSIKAQDLTTNSFRASGFKINFYKDGIQFYPSKLEVKIWHNVDMAKIKEGMIDQYVLKRDTFFLIDMIEQNSTLFINADEFSFVIDSIYERIIPGKAEISIYCNNKTLPTIIYDNRCRDFYQFIDKEDAKKNNIIYVFNQITSASIIKGFGSFNRYLKSVGSLLK